MRDNSRDITLALGARGCVHLTMNMGGNERLATKKDKVEDEMYARGIPGNPIRSH